MRAILRLGRRLLAAGLLLAPAMAIAQQAPPPPDSVGPKALQDFTLNGTVTRPADQPAPQPAAPPVQQERTETRPANNQPTVTRRASAAAPKQVQIASTPTASLPKAQEAAATPEPQPSPVLAAPVPLPDAANPAASSAPVAAAPTFAPGPQPPGLLASGQSRPMLAWLAAALAVIIGAGFLFWRSRARLAYAGHAEFDLFVAPDRTPEPSPAPAPAPAPRAPPMPAPAPAPAPPPQPPRPAATRVVSTGLRPWIDIAFRPLRCVVQDERVTVEFEIELFNSGSAPARAVLVEAKLFNAGADQDAQIAQFFADPAATGERVAVIPPLKRLTLKSQAIALREQVLAYEIAGHPVFVPLVGFNALYSWSGCEGQTSVSHLVGRDTKSEKLGPFRLDLGPHIFRNLGARLLPPGIRR